MDNSSTTPLDDQFRILHVPTEAAILLGNLPISIDVVGAPAKGRHLLDNGIMGTDLLHLAPGKSFELHTHPGHHLLYTVMGQGTVTFDGIVHKVTPGMLYLIPANVPHAVGADPDHFHVIMAIGASPYKALDDPDRMALVVPVEAKMDRERLAQSIGRLDIELSEQIELAKEVGPGCSDVYPVERQTLKHHARDMIACGKKVLELIGETE